METVEMPCPACPPDCTHRSPTCRPICKIWKAWQREHQAPRPKVTEVEKYRNRQCNIARATRIRKGK